MKKIILGLMILGVTAFGCELSLENHNLNYKADTVAYETFKQEYKDGKIDKQTFVYVMKKFTKDTIDLQEHILIEHKNELSPSAMEKVIKLRDGFTKLYDIMETRSKQVY